MGHLRSVNFGFLVTALALLGACRADVKQRIMNLSAPEPVFDGSLGQWTPYLPRPDDKCLSVDIDSITGPYDKLPTNAPLPCTATLLIADGKIPQHESKNVVVLKFEQGDRLCFLLKRSQKLILVFGPDGNLRAVEDHYPPVPTKITE